MNVLCTIRTLVKAVVVAFVIGAVSGFLMGTGGEGQRLDSPPRQDTAIVSAPARVLQ